MKGRRQTEQDNGDEDNGSNNARDETSGGGDSNGNDEDDGPSTRPCRCERLLAGRKAGVNGRQRRDALALPSPHDNDNAMLSSSSAPVLEGAHNCRSPQMQDLLHDGRQRVDPYL
jgi:hypothetical protein